MWGDVDDLDKPIGGATACNALRHILWGVPIAYNHSLNLILITMPAHLPVVGVIVHNDGDDFMVGYADVYMLGFNGCGMPATLNNLCAAIIERVMWVLKPMEHKALSGSEWHAQALIKTMRAAENTALTVLFQSNQETPTP